MRACTRSNLPRYSDLVRPLVVRVELHSLNHLGQQSVPFQRALVLFSDLIKCIVERSGLENIPRGL